MRPGHAWLIVVVFVVVTTIGIGAWLLSRSISTVRPNDPPILAHATTRDSPQVLKPDPPASDFVGSAVCSQCHGAIAETYRSHPMARSLTAVKDLIGDENELVDQVIEPPGSRKYRVRCEGNRLWHHEFLLDEDSHPIYDQQVEVTYALGSGARGRAYLLERDGRLFASSLNWYARTKKWWLAPGYSPVSHKRFEREVNEACLVCHAGRLNEVPQQPVSSLFLETSIGCERCHGPGQRHVDFHSGEKRESADDRQVDPIVNPAKLAIPQREDVCLQCHLQGESQHLRFGRRVTDFRPGMRLEDVWLIFVSAHHHDSGERMAAISQVEQMRSSTCYSRSAGQLGCLSCHDAHSVPSPSERVNYYRQRCETCHVEPESGCQLPKSQRLHSPQANSCIACHMPSLGTSDVPHTSQTDHRILRRADLRNTELPRRSTATDLVFFDQADQRIPPWEAQRARGLMLAGLAEKTRERRFAQEAEPLLEATRKVARDDVEVIEWLGVVKLLLHKIPEARELWQIGLTLEPRHESLLIRLAFFSHDTSDLSAAAGYFDRLFQVNPSRAAFHGRQAHILGQLGDFDRAIEEAHRAIELDPTLSQAHEWLAQVHQLRGAMVESRHHQNMARRLRQAGF
jgi:hypothetical protein